MTQTVPSKRNVQQLMGRQPAPDLGRGGCPVAGRRVQVPVLFAVLFLPCLGEQEEIGPGRACERHPEPVPRCHRSVPCPSELFQTPRPGQQLEPVAGGAAPLQPPHSFYEHLPAEAQLEDINNNELARGGRDCSLFPLAGPRGGKGRINTGALGVYSIV